MHEGWIVVWKSYDVWKSTTMFKSHVEAEAHMSFRIMGHGRDYNTNAQIIRIEWKG